MSGRRFDFDLTFDRADDAIPPSSALVPRTTPTEPTKAQKQMREQTQNEAATIQYMQLKQQMGTRALDSMHRDIHERFRDFAEDIITEDKGIMDEDVAKVMAQFDKLQLDRYANQTMHLTDIAVHRISEAMNHPLVPEPPKEQPGFFARLLRNE